MKKILVYIEPHPIRNMMGEFAGVADLFATLMRVENRDSYKVYANKTVIEAILRQNRHPEFINHLVEPTDKEEAFFCSKQRDWDKGGMEEWCTLMRGGELANQYEKIIQDIHKRYAFDYIINWGTNAAVKSAAKKLHVGYIDMELGCSRLPFFDSVVMDPWGVNGASSISHAHIDDFSMLSQTTSYDDLLLHCQGESGYESQFQPVRFHELHRMVGKSKVAFIPLQLYDDANLLEYSPYSKVVNVLEDILPKLHKAGYTCLIKEHPVSARRKGSAAANEEAKKYALQYENVIWLDYRYQEVSNSFLFSIAEVVITVNSSTGFEALYFDKNVVVLGDAVYKPEGVFPTLNEYLSENFSVDKYKQNIAKIRNFFLNCYLINSSIFHNWSKFYNLIEFIGNMSLKELPISEIVAKFVRFSNSGYSFNGS